MWRWNSTKESTTVSNNIAKFTEDEFHILRAEDSEHQVSITVIYERLLSEMVEDL